MRLDTDPRTLYAEHQRFGPTGKGLMIPDEWRYVGRIGVARGLLAMLNPGSLLDIGCGYGDITPALHPRCKYLGIDYTAWIVDEAKNRYPTRRFKHLSFDEYRSQYASPGNHGGGFGTVVALGVLATVDADGLVDLLDGMAALAVEHVVVSYLDAEHYAGKLQAWRADDIDNVMGPHWKRMTHPVTLPDDASNCTVVYGTVVRSLAA